MGTAPVNFPPESVLEIGAVQTGSKLGLTGSLASTVFFTAPTTGLYLVAMALHIVQTNGAGTLAATLITPSAGSVEQGVSPAAPADPIIPPAIEADLDPSGPTDGYMAAIPVWMNQGQTISVSTTAGSLTGTTYNVFVTALRLF